MKIVIDARFFGTETGIGRYVKELVENLEKIDNENKYVIFLSPKNFSLYEPKNKNFQKKLADIKWYSLKEQIYFGKLVDSERADLVHFPHFNVPVFCRTPYIVTIHDLILRRFPTSAASTKNPIIFYLKYLGYNLILKIAIIRAKKIIVPSDFVKNDIISIFKTDTEKIERIYEGLSRLPREADLGADYLVNRGVRPPYILYVGSCYPHKNLERLIGAFAEVKKEVADLKLVLVGKRNYFSRRLQSAISNQLPAISNRQSPKESKSRQSRGSSTESGHPTGQAAIIFYGRASDEELATLYQHASLYVFPSLIEGFGLPPLEALSFGLPSAVSDLPVFHEVLGEAAFYFNPLDIKDMAQTIKSNLNDDEKQRGIRDKGKDILKKYHWEKSAKDTLAVYQKYGKNFS